MVWKSFSLSSSKLFGNTEHTGENETGINSAGRHLTRKNLSQEKFHHLMKGSFCLQDQSHVVLERGNLHLFKIIIRHCPCILTIFFKTTLIATEQ